MSRTKLASAEGAAPATADTIPAAGAGLTDLLYFAISSCADGKLLPGTIGSRVFSKAMTAKAVPLEEIHWSLPWGKPLSKCG